MANYTANIPDYKPEDRPSAGKLNKILREIDRLGHVTSDSPLEVTSSSTGMHFRLIVGEGRWAKIDDPDDRSQFKHDKEAKYSWIEQERYVDQKSGQRKFRNSSTGAVRGRWDGLQPAYEVNDNMGVPHKTIVWVVRGINDEWLFSYPDVGFWAKVTSKSGLKYSFTELQAIKGCGFQQLKNGRMDKACDANKFSGNIHDGINDMIVFIRKGFSELTSAGKQEIEYLFSVAAPKEEDSERFVLPVLPACSGTAGGGTNSENPSAAA